MAIQTYSKLLVFIEYFRPRRQNEPLMTRTETRSRLLVLDIRLSALWTTRYFKIETLNYL